MPDICVVHLVREKNGIEPFRRFLDSYLSNASGIDHDLLILYKGFYKQNTIASYEELLGNVNHSSLQLSDVGFDIGPYFIAAAQVNYEYLFFLNSFSIILAANWLRKFHTAITEPGVGLVGATGTWTSIIPGRNTKTKNLPLWRRLLRPLLWRLAGAYYGLYFEHFPNYHIRTNGFMIARDTMLKIPRGPLLTKMHVYRLESGKDSITKAVERMGFRVVVVGRDGRRYGKTEWHASGTFWQANQYNLLISDNQTRKYDLEDDDGRLWLARHAWGEVITNLHAKNLTDI